MSLVAALLIVLGSGVPSVFGGGPGIVVHSADTVLGGPSIVGTAQNSPVAPDTVLGGPG